MNIKARACIDDKWTDVRILQFTTAFADRGSYVQPKSFAVCATDNGKVHTISVDKIIIKE